MCGPCQPLRITMCVLCAISMGVRVEILEGPKISTFPFACVCLHVSACVRTCLRLLACVPLSIPSHDPLPRCFGFLLFDNALQSSVSIFCHYQCPHLRIIPVHISV